MKLPIAAALLALTACSTPNQDGAAGGARETAAHAWKLCKIANRSGMTTKPCNVSGERYLDMTIAAVSTRETAAFCHELRMAAVQNELTFGREITLRFYSAYSANGPIASCSFS